MLYEIEPSGKQDTRIVRGWYIDAEVPLEGLAKKSRYFALARVVLGEAEADYVQNPNETTRTKWYVARLRCYRLEKWLKDRAVQVWPRETENTLN
ncbi:MAG: hypothetical protein ACYC27_20615 [Armatimonadota bacterium]